MNGSSYRKRLAALLLAAAACLAACGQQDAGPAETPGGAAALQADDGMLSGAAAEAASPGASGSSGPPAGISEEIGATAGQIRTPPASRSSPPDPSPAANPSPSAAQPPASPAPSAASALPSPGTADEEAARTVTISIVGNAEWGTIVAPEQTALQEGETVAELLIRTLKAHKLAYAARGSGALFYVEGIDGLFEFDDGPTSGWKFRVNGETLGIGAGAAKLKPGDTVEWFYVSKDEDAEKDGGSSP